MKEGDQTSGTCGRCDRGNTVAARYPVGQAAGCACLPQALRHVRNQQEVRAVLQGRPFERPGRCAASGSCGVWEESRSPRHAPN